MKKYMFLLMLLAIALVFAGFTMTLASCNLEAAGGSRLGETAGWRIQIEIRRLAPKGDKTWLIA